MVLIECAGGLTSQYSRRRDGQGSVGFLPPANNVERNRRREERRSSSDNIRRLKQEDSEDTLVGVCWYTHVTECTYV